MLAAGLVALVLLATSASSGCPSTQLAVFSLELHTNWSRELFPKQYPEFRPAAQWSRVVGRTHDSSFQLFSIGSPASVALQTFAEKGHTDGLDAHRQGHGGVMDTFGAEAIPRGEGATQARIFLDGNHSKVSLVTRMVPSPDWFLGIDSFDLCDDSGKWIETTSILLEPLDAGTDNGFTFTSPNWPSDPPQPVSVVTSRVPDHPAGSFNYPQLERLPTIATLTFRKVRVYQLKQEFPPHLAPRTLTSEDLEEMSNQLHSGGSMTPENRGEVTTESTHVSTKVPGLYPETTSYKLQHIDAQNAHIKPISDDIEYKIQHIDSDVEIKTLPTLSGTVIKNLGVHHTYKNKNQHHGHHHIEIYQPSESVVRRVGSVTHHYPSETQGTPLLIHSRHQNQRVRALRRRKLATQRRTKNKMAAERVTESEFLTADGRRFEHN